MTSAFNQAFRLYTQYKTQTAQYRALATQLGYASTGDLNARMSSETYNRMRLGAVALGVGRAAE